MPGSELCLGPAELPEWQERSNERGGSRDGRGAGSTRASPAEGLPESRGQAGSVRRRGAHVVGT